jgi:hypothetical protein
VATSAGRAIGFLALTAPACALASLLPLPFLLDLGGLGSSFGCRSSLVFRFTATFVLMLRIVFCSSIISTAVVAASTTSIIACAPSAQSQQSPHAATH